MKNTSKVLVLIVLTCGAVHSYDIYNDQNFAKELLLNPQNIHRHGRSPGNNNAYKWDRRTYEYGLPDVSSNPLPIHDYAEKEHRRFPKEIAHSPSHGYNYFGPEHGIHRYPGNRFEYPGHPRLNIPQGDYWPAPDSRNSRTHGDDGGAFPNPDPDPFKVSRFPFSPPESLPALTSSPLSEMKTQSCIRNCPSTSEYNPVCGTNGVTYGNPGKLECAKYCGVDVALQRRAPCLQAPNTPPATVTQPTTDTQSTTDTHPPMDTQPPIVTTKAPFESKPTQLPSFVGSDPFADRLVFVSTESPDSSEDFDIDIRSRNLRPDDEIVFED